jgi:hypothetical protein
MTGFHFNKSQRRISEMKQTSKLIGCLVILLCLTVPVQAKGPAGVAETVHNLSSGASWNIYSSDNVDEVCVFCHTPHGGLLTGPLWNHSLPDATSFTHYNSATLSTYLQGLPVSRTINDESLLCMSCHDGSVAVDHLINKPNSIGSDPITIFGNNKDVPIVDLMGGVGARIGGSLADTAGSGDLSDDHPISFSYNLVLADPAYQAGGSKDGELRPVGDSGSSATALGWKGEGVRFFGSDYRVECSSCHDPHVNYESIAGGNEDYRPFLIRPNTGSDLCLSCHDK